MATIASLAVNLIAQTNRFVKPLQDAEKRVDRWSQQTENRLKRVETVSKRAGLALAALKGPVVVAAKLASDYGANVREIHQATGLHMESVQALGYAVEQSNSDMKTFTAGVRAMLRRSAEAAQGNRSFAREFERLGVSVTDAHGRMRSTEELLMDVADAVAGMDSEAEMAAAMMGVMGEAGRKLVPLMRQGAGGIREVMDEAVRLGIVMKADSVRRLAEFGDALTATKNRSGALSREMAVQFLPVLNTLNNWLNRGIDLLMGLDDQTKRNAAMLATITAAVLGFVVALGMLAAGASVAVKALAFVGGIFGILTSPIAVVIGLIALLYTAWTNNWFNIRTKTQEVWGDLKPIFDAIDAFVGDAWATISKGLDVAWKWTAEQAGNAWAWLSGPAWEWIVDTGWAALTGGLNVAWKWTAEKAGQAWDWLAGPAWTWVADTAWPKLTGGLSVAWSWTAEKAGAAWDWLSGPAWAWIRDTGWPTLTSALSVVWSWTATRAGQAWEWLSGPAWDWLSDTAWSALKTGFAVAWEWTANTTGAAWDWLSTDAWEWVTDTAWPTLTSALAVVWSWTAGRLGDAWAWLSGDAWTWVKDTAWPALRTGSSTVWEWTAKTGGAAWTWLSTDAWTWVRDAGWPTLVGSVSTAWSWTVERAGDAWTWLSGPAWEWVSDTAWPMLQERFTVFWTWSASKIGTAWDWIGGTLIPWVTNPAWEALKTGFFTAWSWSAEFAGDAVQWLRETAWPYIDGAAGTLWTWTLELGGTMYEAIKKGFETGDWSDAISVGADVWRTGVKVAVTLGLAAQTVSTVLSGIQTALGLTTTGLAALGVPGAIGAISVAVALAEAWAENDYDAFARKVVAALAGALVVAGLTRSPQMGVLAFTILINFEVGKILDLDKVLPKPVVDLAQDPYGPEMNQAVVVSERAANAAERIAKSQREQAEQARRLAEQLEGREFVLQAAPQYTWRERIKRYLGIYDRSQEPVTTVERVVAMADEFRHLEAAIDGIDLAEFMYRLGMTESGLQNIANGASSAVGEFQMLASARARIEELFGPVDWEDEAERIRAAYRWLALGIEHELGTIQAAAERLQISLEDALHLWWVAGGPALSRLQSLDTIVTMDTTAADILMRRRSFAAGGYTGNIPPDQIAGVVHGQEIVIPAPAVRKGLAGILEWLGVPGFQAGLMQPIPGLDAQTQAGLTGAQSFVNTMAAQLNGIVEMMDSGIESLLTLLETTILDVARDVLPEESFKALEERTLALTATVREGWSSFRSLFQQTDEAAEAADDLASALDAAQQAAEKQAQQQAAIDRLMSQILSKLPVLNAALAGMAAGAVFGPIGSVIGAVVTVMMESESVARAFAILNEMLTVAANALGMLLEPLLPLIYVISQVLTPIFRVLGTILEMVLLPIMPFVFEALRVLGIAILFVAEVFQRARGFILDAVGGLVEGIGRFIDSLPFFSAKTMIQAGVNMRKSAEKAYESAAELADARRDLINLTYDEAMERTKNTEALREATAALHNVPLATKALQALRFEAATRQPIPSFDGGGRATQDGLAYLHKGELVLTPEQQRGLGGGTIIIQNVHVRDGRDFGKQIEEWMRRRGLTMTGNTQALLAVR